MSIRRFSYTLWNIIFAEFNGENWVCKWEEYGDPSLRFFLAAKAQSFPEIFETNRHSKIPLNKVASNFRISGNEGLPRSWNSRHWQDFFHDPAVFESRDHRCCQQDLQVRAATCRRGLEDRGRGAAPQRWKVNVWKSSSWKVWKSRSILPWILLYLCLGPEQIWIYAWNEGVSCSIHQIFSFKNIKKPNRWFVQIFPTICCKCSSPKEGMHSLLGSESSVEPWLPMMSAFLVYGPKA